MFTTRFRTLLARGSWNRSSKNAKIHKEGATTAAEKLPFIAPTTASTNTGKRKKKVAAADMGEKSKGWTSSSKQTGGKKDKNKNWWDTTSAYKKKPVVTTTTPPSSSVTPQSSSSAAVSTNTNMLLLTPNPDSGRLLSISEINRLLDEHQGYITSDFSNYQKQQPSPISEGEKKNDGKKRGKKKKNKKKEKDDSDDEKSSSLASSCVALFQGVSEAMQAKRSIMSHDSVTRPFNATPHVSSTFRGEEQKSKFLQKWQAGKLRYDNEAMSDQYPSRVVESMYVREAATGCTKRTYLKRFGRSEDDSSTSSPAAAGAPDSPSQQQQPTGPVRGDYLENAHLRRGALSWYEWFRFGKGRFLSAMPLPHSSSTNGLSFAARTKNLNMCSYLSKTNLIERLTTTIKKKSQDKWILTNLTCRCDVRLSSDGILSDPAERQKGDDKEVFTVLDLLVKDPSDPSKLSVGVVDIVDAEQQQGGRAGTSKARSKALLERIALDKCLLQLWVSQMKFSEQESILEALKASAETIADEHSYKDKQTPEDGELVSTSGFAIAVSKQGHWTISEDKLRSALPEEERSTDTGYPLGSEDHGREILEQGLVNFYLNGPKQQSNFHTFDKKMLQCVPPTFAPSAFYGTSPSFEQEPPTLSVGAHCPRDCPYLKPGICLPHLEKHSVCNIGGMGLDSKQKLWEKGSRFIPEIIQEKSEAKIIKSIGSGSYVQNLRAGGKPTFNKKKLEEWLRSNLRASSNMPLIFIDFEAVNLIRPPLSLTEHTLSGGFVPFQYSMDVFYKGVFKPNIDGDEANGEEEIPDHFEFLAIGEQGLDPKRDPRKALMTSFVKDIQAIQAKAAAIRKATGNDDANSPQRQQEIEQSLLSGCFIAHHVPFDSAVVKALVSQFGSDTDIFTSSVAAENHQESNDETNGNNNSLTTTDSKKILIFLEEAPWMDTIQMMKQGEIIHPDTYGSNSLKRIYPALCPEEAHQSYAALSAADGVADGLAASSTYKRWFFRDPELDVEKTRQDMLKYCGLDTRAMWQVVRACGRLIENDHKSSTTNKKESADNATMKTKQEVTDEATSDSESASSREQKN